MTPLIIPETTQEFVPLGEYLLLRLCQANPKLRSVFGIPGDFNLALLEHFYASLVRQRGLEFVGICNELNAAYAADGYAKVIDHMAVLITTYGVGELSAINGVAGAFAEFAPVLHIVGTTLRLQQQQAASCAVEEIQNIHHLVPNHNALEAPNHHKYKTMVGHVSVACELLDGGDGDLDKIDGVICAVLQENRPAYLYVPCDVPNVLVPKLRLLEPLKVSELRNRDLLESVAGSILETLYAAKQPAVVGDTMLTRFRAQRPFDEFVEKLPTNFVRLFTTNMGRNVDESKPNFVGTYYAGYSATPEIKQLLESLDVVVFFGHFNNECNNGKGSGDLSKCKVIEVHPDYVRIGNEYTMIKTNKGRAFALNDLMSCVNAKFDAARFVHNDGSNVIGYRYKFEPLGGGEITHRTFTDFIAGYLRPNDVFIVETCSFLFGVMDMPLPKGTSFFSQNFYGSIGWALPATLGACRAARDLGLSRRVVLVQGDGSAQMTVQELSSMIRHDIVAPSIFLMNNHGYTIERAILGPTRAYNDIMPSWRWGDFFKVFGDAEGKKHRLAVLAKVEDFTALVDAPNKINFYEVMLPMMDVPRMVKKMCPHFEPYE